MAGQSRKATLQDIADIVGMSRMSISRILNGKQQTSPEMDQRIREAIVETGYRMNRAASALRQGRALPTVGLIVERFTDASCSSIAEAVADVADERGAVLVVVRERGGGGIEALVSRNVDGILVCDRGDTAEAWNVDRPVVSVDGGTGAALPQELGVAARAATRRLFELIDGAAAEISGEGAARDTV
ncbi:LacI family DNA-binding transcriptional regulator [Microbacterium aquimaris]|uniref:LacI family DNA-binding transcriptional regulator n=1 Tax=Microbacterium aquimaris TaxID=459816 RepID=A0ABU5N525_9MICO|nr:LacI family DNA-binding transcriptional regulator [Microbacterium aquimaris]MDZ8161169.1 LacI family DNA-binding transcriptional regulator [Microbacterium aquimaris]